MTATATIGVTSAQADRHLSKKRLREINGIGENHEDSFYHDAEILSIEDLLSQGADSKQRKQIVDATGISETLVDRFVKQADLMRIIEIDAEYARSLVEVGVDSIKELRRRNPGRLVTALEEAGQTLPESAETVANWIKVAGKLPIRVVH